MLKTMVLLIYFRLWAKMLAADVKSKVNGDTKLAKILTPTYDIGCKRILMMIDFVVMIFHCVVVTDY